MIDLRIDDGRCSDAHHAGRLDCRAKDCFRSSRDRDHHSTTRRIDTNNEFHGVPGMKKLLVILSLVLTSWLTPVTARADLVFANTTGGRLISFDSATPGTILSNVAISG